MSIKGYNVAVGAENMYFEEKGAYTGEILAEKHFDAGVKYVIIGHFREEITSKRG